MWLAADQTIPAVIEDVRDELERILSERRLRVFREHGGREDTLLDHEKIMLEVGPRRAALITVRYVVLTREVRRLYLLRPHLAVEHLQLRRDLVRRGWLKLQ